MDPVSIESTPQKETDSVSSGRKAVDQSKRTSLQSGISEFSFEHHHDETINSVQYKKSTEMLPSPTKPALKLDQLVKKNTELERRTTEQSTLISALRAHIQLLEGKLRESGLDCPPFTEPVMLKENVIRSLAIDATLNKSLEKLQLPPRSADRMKPMLRSPVAQRSVSARSVDAMSQINDSENDVASESIDEVKPQVANGHLETPDLSHENADKEILTPSPTNLILEDMDFNDDSVNHDEEDLNETLQQYGDTTTERTAQEEQELVTPVSVKPNVDWNATIEALKASAEEKADTASVNTETRAQVTPYSGRISSPSPYKQAVNSKSPTGSHFSTHTPQPYAHQSSTFLSTAPSSADSRQVAGGSPPKLPPRNTVITTESLSSIPSTPMSIRSDMPLSRNNLYSESLASDLPRQQNITDMTVSHTVAAQIQHSQQTHTRYPSDVPLFVDPAQLSTVKPEILSTIHGNPSKKSEDPFVSIVVLDRQSSTEMWRFKKSLSQILMLDAEIRPLINTFSLPPVPEKAIFLTNIPSKVDNRRMRIKDYFATLFAIPNIPPDAAYRISRFMSLDVINLVDESNMDVLKEGWLLRRSKGIGNNWKARYCQVDGPFINVFEEPGGAMLEIIKLTGAQIGRQPDGKQPDDKNGYRHAFAVMEPKKGLKSGSFTKHVFCAETDVERDEWVNVLVPLIDDGSGAQSIYSADSSTLASTLNTPMKDISKDSLSPSKATISSNQSTEEDNELAVKEAKRQKKRSFFPFSKKQVTDELEMYKQQHEAETSNIEQSLQDMDLNTPVTSSTSVFQNELQTVVALSSHELYGVNVPSIIYRCISYLNDRSAIYEEGLFRLSGSSALIRKLRESFDTNYDVDFHQLETLPDVNTIAGLLKLWLRELPTNILTRELYPHFKDACAKISDPAQLSRQFAQLARQLPQANYAVMYSLFKFLNTVIQNKDSNKMNLKNLCIVFSPTLNVASEVIVPFLVDFQCVFENGDPIDMSQREVMDLNIPTF